MSITVAALAAELDVNREALANYATLHTLDPDASIPDHIADRIRKGVAAEQAERSAESAQQATGLTLDTYEPSPLVDAAIDAMVHQTTQLANRPAIALVAVGPLMVVAAAVALADLVEKGVAPFAEGPGIAAEPNREASAALTEWVSRRAVSVAVANMTESFRAHGGDTTVIAIIGRLLG